MPNKKKQAPAKVGGYSYDKVVKNKDKNGYPIFFKYVGSKKVRVSQDEYRKVQHTKDYFKKKNGKEWRNKYNEAVKIYKGLGRDQEKKELKEKKEKRKKELEFNLTPKDGNSPFANSMATDIETQILSYGSGEMIRKGKSYFIDKNNLIFVRMFFSEIADIFYTEWKNETENYKKHNTPQITYYWYWREFPNSTRKTDIFILLDKIVFSFKQKFFSDTIDELLIKYFGKRK